MRIADLPIIAWQGPVWRMHRREYAAADHGGSLLISGRFNRGRDRFPEPACWPALYAATAPEIALAEIVRHVTPATLSELNGRLLTELYVVLSAVADARRFRDEPIFVERFLDDDEYEAAQSFAAEAIAAGCEALLVPSATRLGDNLIIFPRQLHPDSTITVVGSREPRLYVARE